MEDNKKKAKKSYLKEMLHKGMDHFLGDEIRKKMKDGEYIDNEGGNAYAPDKYKAIDHTKKKSKADLIAEKRKKLNKKKS